MTENGPRARTLATFSTLMPDVLHRAQEASDAHLDTEAVERSARRAGAPVEGSRADSHLRALLSLLAAGEGVSSKLLRQFGAVRKLGIERESRTFLPRDGQGIDVEALRWLDASPERRGAALRQLLDLGDALPRRQAKPLRFPPLRRAGSHRAESR